jgi:hypothetical protein
MIVALFASSGFAQATASLRPGAADLKSAGALTFGPEGILFVGDTVGGAIFALDTQDRTAAQTASLNVAGINTKIAASLGIAADQILINDVAVNPISKKVYLSVSRGRGPTATPVIVRVDAAGAIQQVALTNIPHSRIALPNPPQAAEGNRNPRNDAITDLAFVDGRVFVAGLSNEEFASKLRSIPFPFTQANAGTSVEIWHASHGRFETNSPVRTFVPVQINREQHILAAYTCTPLVKIPVSQMTSGSKVMGTTIAELGSGNRPLDMITYTKGGADFILMANNSRGVMKMPTANLGSFNGITNPVADKAGVTYETIASLQGVQHLDKFNDTNALVLTQGQGGAFDLKTVALP